MESFLRKASALAFSRLFHKVMSSDEYHFRICSMLMRMRMHVDWRPGIDPAFRALSERFFGFRSMASSDGLGPLVPLERGLDDLSVRAIRGFLSRIEAASEDGKVDARTWYDHDVRSQMPEIRKGIGEAKERLSIPEYIYPDAFPDIFHFHSGLRFVPQDVVSRCVDGRDVIDCGAYNGDSAMVFSGLYGAGKVFAFEPEPSNHGKLLETIRSSGQGNIVPVRAGVGRRDGEARISSMGASSSICDHGQNIDMVRLDRHVEENGLCPGLIKMDIEGHESDALMGAIDAIERHRPILLIAIYHTPEDFYGIKPMLEARLEGYRFMVRHLTYLYPQEVFLIAYPEEG